MSGGAAREAEAVKSFEHGYLREIPISHGLLSSVRTLGEFSGREGLYARQSPEVLDTLRRAAIVQSVESSNRIEGVTVAEGLIDPADSLYRTRNKFVTHIRGQLPNYWVRKAA